LSENKIWKSSTFHAQYSIFPPFHYSDSCPTANTTLWAEIKAWLLWTGLLYFSRPIL
jgi:hypothetical protein